MAMMTTLSIMILTPLIVAENLTMPYPVAIPYSVENSVSFWLTFLYLSATGFTVGVVHISVDGTFFGLLMIMMRHQEILKYRIRHLTNFSRGSEFKIAHKKGNAEHQLKKIVQDHELIYR